MKSISNPQKTLEERRREDFRFFLLCGLKGDMAMYHLFRDRSLDGPDPAELNLSDKD